jgi:hypothetical protein
MIELGPLAWRVVRDVDLKDTTSGNAGAGNTGGASTKGGSINGGGGGNMGSGGGGNSIGGNEGTKGEEEEQEERDAVFYRLEMLGYRVGQGLVERLVLFSFFLSLRTWVLARFMRRRHISHFYLSSTQQLTLLTPHRFSKDRPRFTDTLDVIKFLCKDLWMLVFRKQIDNLKTNHRVHDSLFPTPFPALYIPWN